jgi:nicotinamide riboside kinase
MKYSFNDLLTIAKGQLKSEDEMVFADSGSAPEFVFIDTDMYVMKVWCEFVFGKCHQWILDRIVEREYDLYLLCNIDLPWSYDALREYPDHEPRKQLFRIYKDIMVNQSVPWAEISGDYEQRLNGAIEAVEKYRSLPPP